MAAHLGRLSQTATRHSHQAFARHVHKQSILRDGESFSCKHSGFQASDVQDWAALTGDTNPLHVSETAARDAGFAGTVLPGMLCASLFPAIIGSQFPGALYLTQTLNFRQAALVTEPLEAEVTVRKVSGRRVMFETICRRSSDQAVLVDGAALARMQA